MLCPPFSMAKTLSSHFKTTPKFVVYTPPPLFQTPLPFYCRGKTSLPPLLFCSPSPPLPVINDWSLTSIKVIECISSSGLGIHAEVSHQFLIYIALCLGTVHSLQGGERGGGGESSFIPRGTGKVIAMLMGRVAQQFLG